MATTITFLHFGEVEVNADGRVKTVPTIALAHDADLRETVARAMSQPGTPVTVSNKSYARGLRPRNSRVHSAILQ